MALPSVLVTDTNIWIDLENGGLLAEVFHLPYQFLTTDFAIPEFIHPRWQTLQALGLEVRELDSAHVLELINMRQDLINLSITDLAAFLLAKIIEATLITGDRRLIELAKSNSLSVHGVLWLLDEMVHYQAITSGQAANALGRMLDRGARLPPDECRKRLARWS
jgi:hypothetical protein